MTGLLVDINCQGQLDRLLFILCSPEWAEWWDELGFSVHTVRSVGYAADTDDRTSWNRCQAEGWVLVTANRNDDRTDSLAAAIRDSAPDALPVLTFSDADRIQRDPRYAEVVAIDLLETLSDLRHYPETLLGTGRRFLPKTSYEL
jgi:hypothetical protein